MDSHVLTKAGVVWTKRASLEACTSLTRGIHGAYQGPANASPALSCKPRQWCPTKRTDRLGAQLRCGHIRTQVTSRTHRFCLTGQGPHIVILVCSRTGRHLAKRWFPEHSLDQPQPCLSSVCALRDSQPRHSRKLTICVQARLLGAFCTCWPRLQEEAPALLASTRSCSSE